MSAKRCQSCGTPIDKKVDRGTKANGTLTDKYCGHCYSMGAYLEPKLTVGQMQERVADKICELGLPRFLARWLARGVPKLERWAGPATPRR